MTLHGKVGAFRTPVDFLPFGFVIDRSDARRLQSLVTIVELERNQVLAREGEVGQDFLIMADGLLKLSKALPGGRRQIAAFRVAGDLVTLHRCGTPWPTTAEAIVPSTLYRLEWDQLRRLAARHPRIDRALLDLTGDEVSNLLDRLLALGRMTTEEKVASFLLEFCHLSAAGSRLSREFAIPMRRPEIADYLGLTTETVCRELTRLRRERIIAMPRPSTVVVLNRPVLETLAAGASDADA
ncbi:MAG: Crp/Fnr family transcriptional regulator [Methyloligellaceae bacterium]